MHAAGRGKTHDAGVVNDDDDDGERAKKIETGLAFAILKSRIEFDLGADFRSGGGNAAQGIHANADVDLARPKKGASFGKVKRKKKIPFTLGVIGHFGLAVRDPKKSAQWWERTLGLTKQFEFDGGIAIGNKNVTIALQKGRPRPETFDHMSFHLPNMTTLRKALKHLQNEDVDLEDPGDEIGSEGPGSKNMGIWLHDPDGYRWELSVQNARG
jgi:catechol 2,3-dioxygenase-like lactoylglutathione lyase family enzyme